MRDRNLEEPFTARASISDMDAATVLQSLTLLAAELINKPGPARSQAARLDQLGEQIAAHLKAAPPEGGRLVRAEHDLMHQALVAMDLARSGQDDDRAELFGQIVGVFLPRTKRDVLAALHYRHRRPSP